MFSSHSTFKNKKVAKKLQGRDQECAYLRSSEGDAYRSGVFLNMSTRKTIVRRFFSPCNTVQLDLLVSDDEKREFVKFEEDDEIYDEPV